MNNKRILYSKEFLSGALAGICVRCSYDTTADAAVLHELSLSRIQRNWSLNRVPAVDITGNQYTVYNIGCEDIAPGQEAK